MIKINKKSLLVGLIELFSFSLSFGMEVSKPVKIRNFDSLLTICKKAILEKKFLLKFSGITKEDLKKLPEELNEQMTDFVNKRTHSGSTRLYEITSHECIRPLLILGANPHLCNAFGDTLLLWYLKRDQFKNACSFLREVEGFDVNHRNIYGVCALDIVRTIQDQEIKNELEKLLISYGAKSSFKSAAIERLKGFKSSLIKRRGSNIFSEKEVEKIFQDYMKLSLDDSKKYLENVDNVTKKALVAYAQQSVTCSGLTYLHCAKTKREVSKLLDLQVNLLATTNALEMPLHSMIQRRYVQAARFFVSNVSSEYCNQEDAHHMTPLCYAILSGNKQLVRALLKNKANVCYYHRDASGIISTAHLLASTYNEKMIGLILTKKAVDRLDNDVRLDAMCLALDKGKELLFRTLIPEGNSLDTVYDTHTVPLNFLMYLIGKRAVGCLEKLFSENPFEKSDFNPSFDVTVKNINGVTPLMFAANFTPEFIQALLDRGASVRDVSNNSNTVLHYVANNKYRGEVRNLIVPTIQLLLDNGADINAKNADGDTPLHEAVRENNLECVKFLIEKGADVTIKNNKRKTPWNFVQDLDRHGCAKYFGVKTIQWH